MAVIEGKVASVEAKDGAVAIEFDNGADFYFTASETRGLVAYVLANQANLLAAADAASKQFDEIDA